MPKSKHTEGPWRLTSDSDDADYTVYAKNTPICEWFTTELEEDERIANAKLIAAAPEMLDALKAARHAIMSSGECWDPECNCEGEDNENNKDAYKKITDALNKALGDGSK